MGELASTEQAGWEGGGEGWGVQAGWREQAGGQRWEIMADSLLRLHGAACARTPLNLHLVPHYRRQGVWNEASLRR